MHLLLQRSVHLLVKQALYCQCASACVALLQKNAWYTEQHTQRKGASRKLGWDMFTNTRNSAAVTVNLGQNAHNPTRKHRQYGHIFRVVGPA